MPLPAERMAPRDDLDASLAATLAVENEAPPTEHPTVEELVRYHLHELSPEEAESLQDHLVCCPPCTQAVLALLRSATTAEEAAVELSPEAVDLAWDDLREHLARRPPEGVRLREPSAAWIPPPVATGRRSAWIAAAVAAGLVLATALVILAGWPRRGLEPLPNPHVIEAFPGGEGTLRGESEPVPERAGALFIVLHSRAARPGLEYRAAVVRSDGEVVETVSGLRADPRQQLSFVLRPLPDGDYVAELYESPRGAPIERFSLPVDRP